MDGTAAPPKASTAQKGNGGESSATQQGRGGNPAPHEKRGERNHGSAMDETMNQVAIAICNGRRGGSICNKVSDMSFFCFLSLFLSLFLHFVFHVFFHFCLSCLINVYNLRKKHLYRCWTPHHSPRRHTCFLSSRMPELCVDHRLRCRVSSSDPWDLCLHHLLFALSRRTGIQHLSHTRHQCTDSRTLNKFQSVLCQNTTTGLPPTFCQAPGITSCM